MKEIRWKTAIFSSTTKFFENNLEIGFFKQRGWKDIYRAEINGKKFRFETKGVFRQITTIYDDILDYKLASVEFRNWKREAEVILNDGSKFSWTKLNFWNTKWQISNNLDLTISFKGSNFKGTAEADKYDDLLFMTAFFIFEYFENQTQTAAVA